MEVITPRELWRNAFADGRKRAIELYLRRRYDRYEAGFHRRTALHYSRLMRMMEGRA